MKVIQTVIVKQILTENSKNELLDTYKEKKFQLQKESEQLRFEFKKQEKAKRFPPELLKKQFDNEIRIREDKKKQLDFHIEQLQILPLGSELKENEVQAFFDLNEGDSWDHFLAEKSIIVKDGVVVEIRER